MAILPANVSEIEDNSSGDDEPVMIKRPFSLRLLSIATRKEEKLGK